jgi:hypothetical protein
MSSCNIALAAYITAITVINTAVGAATAARLLLAVIFFYKCVYDRLLACFLACLHAVAAAAAATMTTALGQGYHVGIYRN